MGGYQNSGREVIHLVVFLAACFFIAKALPRGLRAMPGVRRLRLGGYLWSLFAYPGLVVLAVLLVTTGTGWVGNDFGLKHWLYPDENGPRFWSGALLVLLYCEVLLLAYLRDQEMYDLPMSSPARERTLDVVSLAGSSLRAWPVLGHWLSRVWGRSEAVRAIGPCLGHSADAAARPVEREALAELLHDRRRRIAVAPAVVLGFGLRVVVVIAEIALVIVLIENWAYLDKTVTWRAMMPHYLVYVLGLPVGLAVAVGATYVLTSWLPARLSHVNPSPAANRALSADGDVAWVGGLALLYVAGVVLAPAWQSILLPLLLAVLAIVFVRRGQITEGGERTPWWGFWRQLAWSPSGTLRVGAIGLAARAAAPDIADRWVYPAALSAVGAVVSLMILVVRLLDEWTPGESTSAGALVEEIAWFAGLVLGLWLTSRYLRRTRLVLPGSLVAIPALLLHGFLIICTLYRLVNAIPGESWVSWPFRRVVALPMTCLLGAAVALFFFVATLLPRRWPIGLLVCGAFFAYMDGTAIDLKDSELKLRYPDLQAYNLRPVKLDSRDYFLSSYRTVMPLERQEDRLRTPDTTRIGGGRFVLDGEDLLVCLPDGYIPPEALAGLSELPGQGGDREPYQVVLRMPKRVAITSQLTPTGPGFLVSGDVTWENLQNGAVLWAIPPERPGLEPGRDGRVGRYAVFPLQPDWQPSKAQDQVPYWGYREAESGSGPGDRRWDVSPYKAVSLRGLVDQDLYLIGNWAFPLQLDVPEDLSPPPEAYRWYRVVGAGAGGYYPDLWRPEGSDARNPDAKCLNLVRPRVGEVDLLDDLEVTLGVARPWGQYQWLGKTPPKSGEAVRLLITTANRWVMPRLGDRLRFAEGGTLGGEAIYRVWKVFPPLSSAQVDGRFGTLDGLGASSPFRELRELPGSAGGGTRGVAAVIVLAPEGTQPGDTQPAKDEEVLAAMGRPMPSSENWSLAPGEGTTLLDQVEVLRHWKRNLDRLRASSGAATAEGRVPPPCSCPADHVAGCSNREANLPGGCRCPAKHKLVLVTVSGGGIRSALWAVTVLGSLERQLGPTFPYHVRIITGASGGMVGATYYSGTLNEPGSGVAHDLPPGVLAKRLGAADFLSPAASHMAFSDVPRLVASPFSLGRDRGSALEDAWCRIGPEANTAFRATFGELSRGERAGWRPSLVFTPMIVEDGRRLLISNLDFSFAPRNNGAMLLEPGSSLLRPQVSQFGALLRSNAEPGFELYSLTAVEFFRLFPAATRFRAGTAARMSATFPLISPAVTLPTIPARSVVDAGFYDNFGINLVSLWAGLGSVRNWLVENTSGVVIVQIRDHASQVLRTELDFDRRHGGGAVASMMESPGLAALTGDAISAVEARGLLQLSRPLSGLLNSRYSVTSFRNDEQIEDLSDDLRAVPPTTQDLRDQIHRLIEADGNTTAGDMLVQNIAAKIQREDKRFPYTTVVFECPVDAALSWDLTNFEAENIRRGMGPEPEGVSQSRRRPLDLLGNPLDESGRREQLEMIREDYTTSKQYGPLVGDSLVFVMNGVWHNLQRMWLLQEWWQTARLTNGHR